MTMTTAMTMAAATPRTRLPPVLGSSTIKPILKTTSSVLGVRRRADDDGDGAAADLPSSSPTKKRKTVVINESLNEVKDIGSGTTKSLEDVKLEVKLALERHARGDHEDYESLKDMFSLKPRGGQGEDVGDEESDQDEDEDDDDDEDDNDKKNAGRDPARTPENLLVCIVALTRHAAMLGRSCSDLIDRVLKFPWLDGSMPFSRAYIQFLAGLSAVHGSFLTQTLSMMIDKFSDAPSPPKGSIPGFGPVDADTRKQRLHLGLKYLLGLFPDTGRRIVLNLVSQKFPYSEAGKKAHMSFIHHLLLLKETTPDLGPDLMDLILARLVKLDVEMSLDLDDSDDETVQAVMRQLGGAYMEGEDGESDAGSVDSDDEEDDDDDDEDEEDEQARRVAMFKSKLETMDAILDLLFSLYTPTFADPSSNEAVECFQDMLTSFTNVILPHLKSRHTQYLLFHFALKSHQFMDMFVGTLLNIAFESNRPAVVKQAAVAYMASFTARGAKVTSDQVQTIVQTLIDYLEHFRVSHPSCVGPDVRRYSQYYAYFQGLLYIFCFRWRDLLDRERLPPGLDLDDPASILGRDLPWMEGLRHGLQVNISSKFNPLKVCSPVIVDEFAKLSHATHLLYVADMVEKNKKIQLTQFASGSYATGGALRDTGYDPLDEKWTQLEACFPFDPYQLPVSRHWLVLQESYVSWKSIAVLNRDGDDEDDDSDDQHSIREDTATDDNEDGR